MLISSCSNTKFLAEDEKLYTYTWFSEKGFGKIKNKPLKAYELYTVGSAKTNRPFFFLPRTSLTIYNYMQPSGNWGFRHYVHRVFGSPPVLLKDVDPEFRLKVMKQRLSDMGHFDSDISLDLKTYGRHNKKVRAKYNIYFKPAYTFRNLMFINQQSSVDSIISKSLAETLIKTGNDYWIKDLETERERLAKILKNQGYYYFNSNHLLFYADTTAGDKQVDMTLILKDDISLLAYKQFKIDRVFVTVNSNKPSQEIKRPNEDVQLENCWYQSVGSPYKPKRIGEAISIKENENYTLTHHENTLAYLQGMGAFQSVQISYKPQDNTGKKMDAYVKLIPGKPLTTSIEANFATKSNDFVGPTAIATIGHNNVFRGAEKLELKLDGGFEWQKRSKRKEYELGFNSYEIGAQLKLSFPRFLLPFKMKARSERYVPQTYASLGIRSLKRVRYYQMNVSQIRFGYSWRTSPQREFRVEPIAIDYFNLADGTTEFILFLLQYPQIYKSFQQQLIMGSTFSFSYSNNPQKKKLNQIYYQGIIDLSGNMVDGIYNLANLKDEDGTGRILDVPYSQYARFTNDLRYYIYFNEKRQIAFRLLGGIGIAYGNSEVLPYAKQYFAGGSQDIRAFYARSLGPGSYIRDENEEYSFLIDQSGDIKLLGSVEYRFPITYRTSGAFFVDAGNVWLLREDDSRPGGKFEANQFLKDVAVGSGLGIRVDISYLILRLDAAIPIKKPYLSGSERWIFNNTSFFGDYIFSLAVGYPF